MQHLQHHFNYISTGLQVVGQSDILHKALKSTGPFAKYIINGTYLTVVRVPSPAVVGKTRFQVTKSSASVKSRFQTKGIYIDEDQVANLSSINFTQTRRGTFLQIATNDDLEYQFYVSADLKNMQTWISSPNREFFINLSKLDKRFVEYSTTTIDKGPTSDNDEDIAVDEWSQTSNNLQYIYGRAAARLNEAYNTIARKCTESERN